VERGGINSNREDGGGRVCIIMYTGSFMKLYKDFINYTIHVGINTNSLLALNSKS